MRISKTDAFTLLEVMAALAMMSIVLVSVYKMHSQTIRMSEMVKFYTLAPMLAQSKMAEFDTKPPKDQDSGSGNFGYQYPGYRWEIAVEETKVTVPSSIDKKKSDKKSGSDSKKSESDKSRTSFSKASGSGKTASEFDKKILLKKVDVTVFLQEDFRYSFRTYRLMTEEDSK